MLRSLLIVGLLVATPLGCAAHHQRQVGAGSPADKMTVGTVQREIRKGMSGAEVAEALGSPNIVTTDEKGREVWVYDKVATDVTYSQSEGFGSILIVGIGARSGAASTSQRTLTVVVKFDEGHRVRDFAYHASQF